MVISRLQLQHFRNYQRLDLPLAPGVTILHGPNAGGKTNILEAILALATTKSFRARSEREIIDRTGADDGAPYAYARILGDVETADRAIRVEMVVAANGRPGDDGGSSVRKQFRVNGVVKRAGDVVGEVKAVLFSPDDIDLITGSPSLRRRFMDVMLCQVDRAYLRTLQAYGRIVQQRNALLMRLHGHADPALLEFWDSKLITTGASIIETRRATLAALGAETARVYGDLAGTHEDFALTYLPSVAGAAGAEDVADTFRTELARVSRKEREQRVTLVGPHRDDIGFAVAEAPLQSYGSRGQQRTAALALRLAEARYIASSTGDRPILLFDEALSELDPSRRDLLLRFMGSYPQVLTTGANLAAFPAQFREGASVFQVESGIVHAQVAVPE